MAIERDSSIPYPHLASSWPGGLGFGVMCLYPVSVEPPGFGTSRRYMIEKNMPGKKEAQAVAIITLCLFPITLLPIKRLFLVDIAS